MFFREFELPIEPKFNDLTVSILDFGAKADNESDASVAINEAMSYVSKNGGGKVVVPAGFFTLTTEAGAYASSRAYTLTITVDPNYTGINGVWAESLNSNAIFDLNGRKVQQIEKGKTYIKNGKAFIVR